MLERAEYAALLRELRGDRTLDAVADDLGTKRQSLIRWEKGVHMPSPRRADQLADYYGDDRLRHPPPKGNGLDVSESGLRRLLELLREAVTTLEQALDEDQTRRQ